MKTQCPLSIRLAVRVVSSSGKATTIPVITFYRQGWCVCQIWEKASYFAATPNAKEPYCIMIPPPNVTGSLHMGHAFQDTIMDALTRYHRMKGHSTLWQAGTDHAGIATQMVVERLCNAEGKTRHDYGRDEFIKKSGNGKKNPAV